jgi:biotin operon repressor
MSGVNTIFKVWGNQKGWVRLPRKLRSTSSPKGPKNHAGTWEEKMFQWPQDSEGIINWVKDSVTKKYDLYWCPSVFQKSRSTKNNIRQLTCLYADLDEVKPEKLPKDLRPSMAWESSPGRYAAIWNLKEAVPSDVGEKLNKKLTYFIGADPGGWDLTQVLRVPGLRNYKYEGAPKGQLLWYDESHFSPTKFESLPDVDDVDSLTELDAEEILESEPSLLPELVKPYLSKLGTKTLELLFATEDDVLLEDRSARLWELECKLLESGVPQDAVVKLVAACNWNKYKGRRDETRRIVGEVEKAAQTVKPSATETEYKDKSWTSYCDLMGMELTQPGWMIEGIWQRTSHGMISGEPKTYKSVIASDMIVSVASGTDFMDKFPVHHSGPVLVIQEENDPWLVKDRVAKIANSRGLLDGKVQVVNNHTIKVQWPPILPISFMNNKGFDFTNEEDRRSLEQTVEQVNPVLIVFDPLYLMMGGKDENSSKDIRPMLNWLLKLRYVYKTSVIVIHHWNKNGKSDRGGQRMLGSVLFHGWVESAMYTQVINEEQHEIAVEREFRSFSKPAKIDVVFKFGEPGELTYEAKIADFIENNDDAVYDLIKGNAGVTEAEIKEALGISKQQLKERLKSLKAKGLIIQVGELWKTVNKEERGNEE